MTSDRKNVTSYLRINSGELTGNATATTTNQVSVLKLK